MHTDMYSKAFKKGAMSFSMITPTATNIQVPSKEQTHIHSITKGDLQYSASNNQRYPTIIVGIHIKPNECRGDIFYLSFSCTLLIKFTMERAFQNK